MKKFLKENFIYEYKKEIGLLCFFAILSIIFTVLSPLLVRNIIDEVILQKDISLLIPIILQLLFLYLLSTLAIFCENYLNEYLMIKIFEEKTSYLLPILMNNDHTIHEGDLISRLTDNLRAISHMITFFIPKIIVNIINIIIPLGIMIFINFKLFILTFIPAILSIIFFSIYGKKLENIEKEVLENNSQIFSILKEIFHIREFIVSYQVQNLFLNKYHEKINKYKNKTMKFAKYSSVVISFESILTGIPMLILIISGSYMLINNELSLGNFMAFTSYILLFFNPMMELGENWVSYKTTIPAVDRIEKLYSLKKLDEEKNNKLQVTNGIIEFKNVSFTYDEKKIFDNFNLIINSGINYIVGENGSGKTTLLKLICNLNSPDSGRIMIDKQNIENIQKKSISENIGIVFSKPYLFEDTIYNNIILGNANITNEEIIKISKKINLYEFIMSLPNKFDTIIDENAINLSDGEKQKIALCRVLLRKPKIILFDEVTHSIDKQSREEIKNCIQELGNHKTIIIIDHDLDETSCEKQIIKI